MNKEVPAEIFEKYPAGKREGLIPILLEIQKEKGFLSEEAMQEVGRHLNIPANKVYCVATFYDRFRFKPAGRNIIQMCNGTACHLTGSTTFLGEIVRQLKVAPGDTSKDRRYSLEVTNCMGACDASPVIRVNDTIYSRVTPEELMRIIRSLKEKTD
jgi:NADH-quinone oxidoreductase E subunit